MNWEWGIVCRRKTQATVSRLRHSCLPNRPKACHLTRSRRGPGTAELCVPLETLEGGRIGWASHIGWGSGLAHWMGVRSRLLPARYVRRKVYSRTYPPLFDTR